MSGGRTREAAWAREAFRGLENMLLPSFTPDMEQLDETAIRLDVRRSIEHDFFSTLCVLETRLSLQEAKRFLDIAADAAGADILVGVTLAGTSTQETLELARHAERAGCSHAVLGFPLDFQPGSEQDILAYVQEVAAATSLALVLTASDHLGFTRLHVSGLPLEVYEQIADIPEVVALRIDTLEPGLMTECFERFGDRLLVTSSNFLMLPLLVDLYGVQWSGGWPPEALQTPEDPRAVECFAQLRRGETETAMELYWRLVPAYRVLMAQMAPIEALGVVHGPLIKLHQWCVGGNGGVLREPSPRIGRRQMDAALAAYQDLGITPQVSHGDFHRGRSGTPAAVSGRVHDNDGRGS